MLTVVGANWMLAGIAAVAAVVGAIGTVAAVPWAKVTAVTLVVGVAARPVALPITRLPLASMDDGTPCAVSSLAIVLSCVASVVVLSKLSCNAGGVAVVAP